MPLLLIYSKVYSLGGLNTILQALFLMSPPVWTDITALFPVISWLCTGAGNSFIPLTQCQVM